MRIIALVCLVALAGCGAQEAEIGRLSEQDLPEETTVMEAVPGVEAQAEAESGGLLARLFGGGAEAKDTQDAAPLTLADGEEGAPPDLPEAATEAATEAEAKAETDAGTEAQVQTASLTRPEELGVSREVEKPEARRGGLFGLLTGGGTGLAVDSAKAASVTSEIAPGTVLPYGRVARICGLNNRQMGKRVESFPERRGKYALYDSQPGSTALRTFYLTGFDDGCARQFSAALALFGTARMHEQLRYGLPAEVHPYSTTDKAYEDLKVRVCRVPRRKPCGSKIGRLEGDTVFVSIYERFAGSASWTNLLLHDGAVLAQDKKGI